jgi:hypothetical protein
MKEFEKIIHYDRIGNSDMYNCHEVGEIVRCKDCKYWHDPDENKWGDCYEWGGYSQENDYCSWGEKKDEVEK